MARDTEAAARAKERAEKEIGLAILNFTATTGFPVRNVFVVFSADGDDSRAAIAYDVEVRLGFKMEGWNNE